MKISISVTKEELLAAKDINQKIVREGTVGTEITNVSMAAISLTNLTVGRYLLSINDIYSVTFVAGKDGSATVELDIQDEVAAKFYKFQAKHTADIFSLCNLLNKGTAWLKKESNQRKVRLIDRIFFGGFMKSIQKKVSALKAAWKNL